MSDKTENTEKKQKKNAPHLFQPGESGNPNGRPKGSLNFATKWFKAIEKIAETNNMTADEVEEQLLQVGYKKARGGDYNFYRDVFDRVYGKPMQRNEHTGADGKDLFPPASKDQLKRMLED